MTAAIPLSSLGTATGRFYLGEERPLITMRCYFDGSVGGASDEWLTLGGFAASDNTWASVQREWDLMRKNRTPVADYVHMTDLVTGNNGFSGNDGWGKDEINRLIWDAVSVLASHAKDMCAFACAIDTNARARLRKEGYVIPDPAVICAQNGIGRLLLWYTEKKQLELAHLFFDQNEHFIRSIRRRFLEFERRDRRLVTDDLFWGSIANVQPLSMRDTPGIQAADIIAWAFTRRLRNKPGDPWAGFADTLIGNRQRTGLLTATQLDPITEEFMRIKYPKRGDSPSPS